MRAWGCLATILAVAGCSSETATGAGGNVETREGACAALVKNIERLQELAAPCGQTGIGSQTQETCMVATAACTLEDMQAAADASDCMVKLGACSPEDQQTWEGRVGACAIVLGPQDASCFGAPQP